MRISPDGIVFWQWNAISLNATIVFTWLVMLLLVVCCWLVTRRLSSSMQLSRLQNLLEVIVLQTRKQVREISHQDPDLYVHFIGTLFLFIAVSNTLNIVPGFQAPTGSLSTTAALAGCVFVAVPLYGIRKQGLGGYLIQYVRPTPFMLPFNVMGELSRTLALAVRLFGNVMSGSMIGAMLLAIAPLIFPILMQLLGLLTGIIQAYIFAILATVYIAAATQTHSSAQPVNSKPEKGEQVNG